MSMVCTICNHNNRLEIDREIVQGKSLQMIANSYGVDWQAVRRHKEGHLSRQLTQAYEKKSDEWAMDLLDHLRNIVNKAESIFDRNFAKDTTTSDIVALNALREQRGTFELLAKIVAYSQTKEMEKQVQERKAKEIDLKDFSKDELLVMYKLGVMKQGDDDLGLDDLELSHKQLILQPIVTAAAESSAPPQDNISPTEIEPDEIGIEQPAVKPVVTVLTRRSPSTQANHTPEIVEPDKPRKTLPPRPVKLIPGWDESCMRRPY